MKSRCWFETTLASVSAVLGLLTIAWKDWIEVVTGTDPEGHGGAFEWIVVFALLGAALILGSVARR